MEEELISVIVPVYNVEKYLPKCLESISSQTYRNLEIILVDDGSSDGSGLICEEFAKKDLRAVVIHQPNKGLWAARNAGQAMSKGEYLVFPDADDFLHPEFISILYLAINWQGKKYPMSLCGFEKTTSSYELFSPIANPEVSIISQRQLICGLFGVDSILYGAQWNKLYRRAEVLFPINRPFLRNQDGDSNLRFYHFIGEVAFVPDVLYYYVQRPGQLTKSLDYWDIRLKADIMMISNALEEFPDVNLYDDILIPKLYKRMILLKGKRWRSPCFNDISLVCHEIEYKAHKRLLKCKIGFPRKLFFIFLLHNTPLVYFFLRISHNI